MFQTILKNASGVARYYGFLPPYGRHLASGAEISVPAGVLAGSSVSDRRRQAALQKAINAGHITVKESPALVLFDTTNEVSRVVAIDNNTYGSVDPANLVDGVLALPILTGRTVTAASGANGSSTTSLVNTGGALSGNAWAILSGAVANLTINASTGVVSWTTAVAAGTYDLVIRATNARGSDTATMRVTLTP